MTETLSELLGQYHDYAVLRFRINDLQKAGMVDEQRQRLICLIEIRQQELRKEAFQLGSYLFAEKPKQLVSRWRKYWQIWSNSPGCR